jgi:hypothetical protein
MDNNYCITKEEQINENLVCVSFILKHTTIHSIDCIKISKLINTNTNIESLGGYTVTTYIYDTKEEYLSNFTWLYGDTALSQWNTLNSYYNQHISEKS